MNFPCGKRPSDEQTFFWQCNSIVSARSDETTKRHDVLQWTGACGPRSIGFIARHVLLVWTQFHWLLEPKLDIEKITLVNIQHHWLLKNRYLSGRADWDRKVKNNQFVCWIGLKFFIYLNTIYENWLIIDANSSLEKKQSIITRRILMWRVIRCQLSKCKTRRYSRIERKCARHQAQCVHYICAFSTRRQIKKAILECFYEADMKLAMKQIFCKTFWQARKKFKRA